MLLGGCAASQEGFRGERMLGFPTGNQASALPWITPCGAANGGEANVN